MGQEQGSGSKLQGLYPLVRAKIRGFSLARPPHWVKKSLKTVQSLKINLLPKLLFDGTADFFAKKLSK